MYEKSIIEKVRFNYKGSCPTEDLYDIPLTELDTMFKQLSSELKEQKEESLLNIKSKSTTILELKINIIKDIVFKRLLKIKAAEDKNSKAKKKEKLLNIISQKQDSALNDMSIDDLNKLVKEL